MSGGGELRFWGRMKDLLVWNADDDRIPPPRWMSWVFFLKEDRHLSVMLGGVSSGSRRMRNLLAWIVVIVACLTSRAGAQAQRGDWEVSLAGTGASSKDFDQNAVGVRASLGYFVLDHLELSLRQQLSYSRVQESSATDAATYVAIDFNWPMGADRRWVPYVGGNGGFFYGDNFSSDFEVAPEVGLKYFVNRTTFLYVQAEYQTFFNSGGGGGSGVSDRQFIYQIGIGFRF
jgi:hypothetical protein